MTEKENPEGVGSGEGTQLCEELQRWFGNKTPTLFFRSHMDMGRTEICPWMELNIIMCHSDGPLWAIRHPGKDGGVMEV